MDFHPHAASWETGELHKGRGCNILMRLPGRSRWAEPDWELSRDKLIYLCLFFFGKGHGEFSVTARRCFSSRAAAVVSRSSVSSQLNWCSGATGDYYLLHYHCFWWCGGLLEVVSPCFIWFKHWTLVLTGCARWCDIIKAFDKLLWIFSEMLLPMKNPDLLSDLGKQMEVV